MATAITTELIKQLRESTGISVMQCQRALEEAQGNMQKALAILKKASSDIAMKKMSREAKDGRVCIKTNSEKAVLISLHCETDFVSRNADFVNLLLKLGDIALAEGIEKMKATSKAMIDSVVQKTGENIQLGENYEVAGDVLGNYVHNNKIRNRINQSQASGERPEVSKFLKMISNYKHRIKEIKHKIKEEENT